MWWNLLPCLGLIAGLYSIPRYGLPLLQYAYTGRPHQRIFTEGAYSDAYQRLGWRRDVNMTGNEYDSRGLDYIEDD